MADQIVITILSASLSKNMERLAGRMDPYATLHVGNDEQRSRTPTHWNAHQTPVWNHECEPISGGSSNFQIKVWEDGHVSKAKHMGTATGDISELLKQGLKQREDADLTIMRDRKRGGTEPNGTVKISIVRKGGDYTSADASRFASPAETIGVSGGTAAFYNLRLQDDSRPSPHYFIGKDLARAADEITFYETMLKQIAKGDGSGLKELLAFAFEYAGVLTTTTDAPDEPEPKQLLVLRNLFDGCTKLRLLDLKIGQRTASAGWQGKSRQRAVKQGLVDKTTNSHTEGFRLEGFDGPPPTLDSMDPLMDIDNSKSKSNIKAATRMLLQHMDGREIFMHFIDLHSGLEDADMATFYSAPEFAELVLHQTLTELVALARACRRVRVPQKWVGSSVALGFDSGELPARDEGKVRNGVMVNIFDWGRSELNTSETMAAMSEADRKDRETFWNFYKGGIERLGWNAASVYWNRFGNADAWKEVQISIYDFDALSRDDFMGQITVPVEETPEAEVELTTKGRKKGSTITYSMHWRSCPDGSRLKGTWRVHIVKAKDLPNMDTMSVSDPYCSVRAVSVDGRHACEQATNVIANDLNPTWDETLDLPIAKDADAIRQALSGRLGEGDVFDMFSTNDDKSSSALRGTTVKGLVLLRGGAMTDTGFSKWKEQIE